MVKVPIGYFETNNFEELEGDLVAAARLADVLDRLGCRRARREAESTDVRCRRNHIGDHPQLTP